MSISLLQLLKQCFNESTFSRKELLPDSLCSKCYESLENFNELQSMSNKSMLVLGQLLNGPTLKIFGQSEIELPNIKNDPLQQTQNSFEAVLVKVELNEVDNILNLENETHYDDINSLPDSAIDTETLSRQPKQDFTFRIDQEHCDSATSLNFRMSTNNDALVFNCDKCDSSFRNKFQFKQHVTKSHTATEIVCKYGCGERFHCINNAEAHYGLKHNNPENNLRLEQLQDVEIMLNNTEKSMDIALTEHFPVITRTTCTVCFQNFSNISGLRTHMATHAETRPFQCDQCDRGFNLKTRLKRHISEIHTDTPLQIPCKFECGKIFSRLESAMNHYRNKHILPEKGIQPKVRSYVCEDCGRSFKTMYSLKEHSYIHRPMEERPFQCEQCKKRFIGKHNFEIHLLRHAGIKNFECKLCGLKTITNKELQNHMNHHTKEKQVVCPLCSKVYTNPENLRRHTLIVHQGVKKYKCRFCDNMFGKPDHLKHHEMRHTGERPHKCEICDRDFIQLVALKAHMKTHNKMPKLQKVVAELN